MSGLKLEIISPEQVVLQEEVEMVALPAMDGSLGVMRKHTPMFGGLDIGVLRYRINGEFHTVACNFGVFEMRENTLRVLADTAERGDSIDVMRAQEAKRRAERRLKERAQDLDYVRAELALKRAMARLKAAAEENKTR